MRAGAVVLASGGCAFGERMLGATGLTGDGYLMAMEVGKRDVTTLVITETMHERKKVMFMNSDAIVVLPGGAGSLDEFFEVLTWAQIGLHKKPIFLVDSEGYWQPLEALLAHIVAQGFADASMLRLYTSVPDVGSLETALRAALC